MSLTLESLRACFEGHVPAVIATCAPDGTPNAAYLSQVHYVDSAHVALSFQFFNKTRSNVLANTHSSVWLVDPDTAAHYRLSLRYLRTETEGPLFEHMKARLAGIASHTGMSKVFHLRGADIYSVQAIECVRGATMTPLPRRCNVIAALRSCSQRLATCTDLDGLLDEVLRCLETAFGIHHAMLLMLSEHGDRLYTVGSRGYAASGIGSEIALGEGVIGVAARERTPIRINHMTHEYLYSCAMRLAFLAANPALDLETEIPLPGLAESRSQLAVPIARAGRLLGVLYVESPEDRYFNYEDEDALVTLADHLALLIGLCELHAESHDEMPPRVASPAPPSGAPVPVRHFPANDSIFIGDDYLIKGVAGAIFWKLLRHHAQEGRTEFSNRELRLDPTLRLPELCDNLETRLILLQRRLADRCDYLRIEKAGRGRFRLVVGRPLQLSG